MINLERSASIRGSKAEESITIAGAIARRLLNFIRYTVYRAYERFADAALPKDISSFVSFKSWREERGVPCSSPPPRRGRGGGSFFGFASRRFRPTKKSASPSPPSFHAAIYSRVDIFTRVSSAFTPARERDAQRLISAAQEEDSPAS